MINENNTSLWVIAILAVLIVIGFFFFMSQPGITPDPIIIKQPIERTVEPTPTTTPTPTTSSSLLPGK